MIDTCILKSKDLWKCSYSVFFVSVLIEGFRAQHSNQGLTMFGVGGDLAESGFNRCCFSTISLLLPFVCLLSNTDFKVEPKLE